MLASTIDAAETNGFIFGDLLQHRKVAGDWNGELHQILIDFEPFQVGQNRIISPFTNQPSRPLLRRQRWRAI